MLPKNTFRDRRLARLKIFAGPAPAEYQNNVLKTWRDSVPQKQE
jgi:large subunit ribosomal protein L13